VKAEWSEQARRDLVAIFEYIAEDNPSAARRLLKRIRGSHDLLLRHPMMGRVVPEFEVANIRELIVVPYRVIYQVQLDCILFLTVIHGRRSLRGIGPAAFIVPDDSDFADAE